MATNFLSLEQKISFERWERLYFGAPTEEDLFLIKLELETKSQYINPLKMNEEKTE